MELAVSKIELGKFAEAEPLLRTCLHIRRGTLDEPHWLTAYTESLLGECLTELGQHEEAEPLLINSYPSLEEHPEQARAALQRIIRLYDTWDRPDQAAEWRTRQSTTQPAAEPEDDVASGSD